MVSSVFLDLLRERSSWVSRLDTPMGLILHGSSDIGAYVRSNLHYLIRLRHSIRSRAVINPIFFPPKSPIYFHGCARCSELPSHICTMALPCFKHGFHKPCRKDVVHSKCSILKSANDFSMAEDIASNQYTRWHAYSAGTVHSDYLSQVI